MAEGPADSSTAVALDNCEVTEFAASVADVALPPPAPPSARPSGLRPPSKIGRICAGGAPKPAIPPSPKNNGSTATANMMTRRFSDDYTRKHLADVQEADEELEGGILFGMGDSNYYSYPRERKPSTCSTYSVTSMDALWENHPRRLSEAGLRRTSDHSVVLTEDTDSFIIGDRVWVGGSKPGQIAYIGETQFAPGEWAGVVLDEPIGKNDGSVAGVRYFQCESRRGVFSRLTRLTHEPLASVSPASPCSELAGSINGGSRPPSALRTPASPGPRTPSSPGPRTPSSPGPRAASIRARRSASPTGSMRSVGSRMSTSTIAAELRIGDRVIVSSSQGSKAGILRYMGPTEFAQGQWCGVELDDPIGKNDGSVEGKRYFECGPRFGLFAPQSKVSRSPSNRRPTSCAVHGSKVNSPPESTASMTSSIIGSVTRPRLGVTSLRLSGPRVTSTPMSAKNTLQELLREKQQHIEKLIKEHEVERGELAKITLQTDRIQTALIASQKENSQLLKEIEKLKAEYKALSGQLEDEKQKVEDLMFRAEEDNIHKEDFTRFKDDLLKEKEKLSSNVLSLESELENSKRQIDELQAQCVLSQAQHKGENEILLAQHKDEVQAAHALAAELQKLLDEAHILLREKDADKESLSKSHLEEINKIKMESERTFSELKYKLNETQVQSSEEIRLLKENLGEATHKINLLNENINKSTIEHNNVISELRSQIDQKQKALDVKTQENIQVTARGKECELTFKKELDKLKMNLSAKILDCETLNENNKELSNNIKDMQMEYETLKANLDSKGAELEALSNNSSKYNEDLKKKIEELGLLLNEKQSKINAMQVQLGELQKTHEQATETHKEVVSNHTKEIASLHKEIDNIKHENSIKYDQLINDNNKTTQDKDSCINSLDIKLQELTKALEIEKETNHVLEMKNNSSEEDMRKLNEILSNKQQELNELSSHVAELNSKLSALELESGDLNRKLRSEIEKSLEIQQNKEKLENELSNLSSRSVSSNEQVNILTSKLKDGEKELQSIKEANRDKINELERKEQELIQQLEKIKSENSKLNEELSQTLSTLEQTKESHINKIKQLDEKLCEVHEKYSTTVSELEIKHQNSVTDLIKEIENKNNEKECLKEEYDQLNRDTSSIINDLNHRLEILQESGQSSESQLKEKLNELITIQNELNQKLEISQSNENRLQDFNQKLEEELKNTKDALEIASKNVEEKSNLLQDQFNCLENEKKSVIEKDNLLKESQEKLAICELEIKSNLDIIAEKDRQICCNNNELKKVLDDKYELEKKLSESATVLESLQQEIKILTDESSTKNLKIREQEELVTKFKEELQYVISNRKDLESEAQQNSVNLTNLENQNEALGKQVEGLEKTVAELNVEVINRQERIVTLENELINFSAMDVTLQKLKAESETYLKDVENKNAVITQLNENISLLKKDLTKDVSEKEQRVRSQENEIAELKTSHLHEVGEMKKSIHNLQNEKQEMLRKLTELEEANIKIVELKEQVERSNEDIIKWTTLNEAQKKNYEQLNTQLQDEVENLKGEAKKDRKQLKERLNASESACSDYSKQLDEAKIQNKDLQTKLNENNETIKELQNKIQYLEVSSEKKTGEEKSELQKLLLQLQNCHKAHDEESKQLKSEISVLNEQVAKKSSDSTKYSNHITSLENDIKRYKSQNECLVQEIAQLTNDIKECQKSISKPDLNSNSNIQKTQIMDTDAKRLLEEKEEVVGQVNFLNSVIVDMQRKNEQLKARVEVLEMGCTPQEADEYNYNGMKLKQVAPRMYCDICDVFDAHETEDCPRQTTDVDAPASHSDKKRIPPPPRPYCEICEVFGHATEDCDEEETY